jgi:transposase
MRKTSGKKPGGQKGHQGYRLQPADNPDHTVSIKPEGTCECGRDIEAARIIDYVTRQVFDIILPVLTSTEYRGEVRACECGKVHRANFPDEVKAKVQYGSTLKSLAVYLKHHGMISYDRLQELYKDLFGVELSQGSLVNFITECSKRLESVDEEIKEAIIRSDIVHFDESGFRILGALHWLHSASTKELTYYFAHKRRGTAAMTDMGILPYFAGTAIHDHWESYYTYMRCRHGLCNAHHLRELIYFAEHNEKWAEKLMHCLLDAKNEKDELLILSEKRILYYKKRVKRILREGLYLHPKRVKMNKARGRQKQSPQHNLLSRIHEKVDDVLRFIIDPAVPFDNNQGLCSRFYNPQDSGKSFVERTNLGFAG